jgi:membrane-bound ClpP family serine protease
VTRLGHSKSEKSSINDGEGKIYGKFSAFFTVFSSISHHRTHILWLFKTPSMFEKVLFAAVVMTAFTYAILSGDTREKSKPASTDNRASVSGYAVSLEDSPEKLIFRFAEGQAEVGECYLSAGASTKVEPGDAVTLVGTVDASDQRKLMNCSIK